MTQRTVFMTGCSSGIGLATAKQLHAQGWRVLAGYRKAEDQTRLQALSLTPIRCDLNDSASIAQAAQQVLSLCDHQLDALVNNAGYAQPGAFEDLSTAALRQQFESNVFGLHQLTQALLPSMRKNGHGRIVMISSILGLVPLPYRGAYNASKHALEALSSALRCELHGSGIHVSVIQPGPIVTAFRSNAMSAHQKAPAISQWHHNTYERWEAEQKSQRKLPMSLGPEAVAKRIVHAINHPRPRAYYKVTLASHLLAFLYHALPTRCWDQMVRAFRI